VRVALERARQFANEKLSFDFLVRVHHR
jgi:hypothetical protein